MRNREIEYFTTNILYTINTILLSGSMSFVFFFLLIIGSRVYLVTDQWVLTQRL